MSWRAQNVLSLLVVAAILLLNCLPANSQEKAMALRANGPFDVKITPQASNETSDGMSMGRMSVDKQFHGDLEGTGKAEMLTGMTAVKGSAAYVAIERITGTLKGRSGSFMMQHSGTMTRGAPRTASTPTNSSTRCRDRAG